MYSDLFSAESLADLQTVLPQIPFAIWETLYVTLLSTFLATVLGLPLGVLLVVGEKGGVLPLPKGVLHVLNSDHQPAAVRAVPDFDDYGVPPVPAHHRHDCGHGGHYCTLGGGGVPVHCQTGGGQLP